MNNAVTDDELREAESLCNQADPPPWCAWQSPGGAQMVNTGMVGKSTISLNYNHKRGNSEANADFVAMARLLMPKLIAEVRRLRIANST